MGQQLFCSWLAHAVLLALPVSYVLLRLAYQYIHDKALCVLQYRTTVAKMLAKQANDPRNPAQFIITTFHPQIIHETDKVYGVSHQNRISRYGLLPADLHFARFAHAIHSLHDFRLLRLHS